jgi:hypothetical protein
MANNNNKLEKRLWDAADELRANSKPNSFKFSVHISGGLGSLVSLHQMYLIKGKERN